jgi:hypothetical protein
MAAERRQIEDRILDLVIALEALLLSGITQPGELLFRFALHGACFGADNPQDRESLFEFLKAAYRARSRIAHGASLSLRKLVMFDGSRPQDLPTYADAVEAAARDVLRRSVNLHVKTGRFVQDWDQLVLGSRQDPVSHDAI